MKIETKIIEEAGYNSSMLGLSFNFDRDPKNSPSTANKLKSLNHGHNKFLRQICLWVDITAPRFFFQEFDQYKVGTVSQSQSTIHTVLKNELTQKDFDSYLTPLVLRSLNVYRRDKDFLALKQNLPEGFLQRRIYTMNYSVLNEIILQRKGHKLPHWKRFIDDMKNQVEHPELLVE